MNKKIIFALIFLLVLFIKINTVRADDNTVECHYFESDTDLLILKFNSQNYEYIYYGELVDNGGLGNSNKLSREKLIEAIKKNQNSCPFLCKDTRRLQGEQNIVGWYFSSTYTYSEYGDQCLAPVNYSNEYQCGTLQKYMDKLSKLSGKKTAEDIAEQKRIKDSIKSFCSIVLENLNYNDANNCVNECLSISEKLSDVGSDVDTCGFSKRLIVWVNNILKWVRYILPVIVIILGIIDFIKAIASDKDDDMKKSQKHFIIRLIAAALAFLVPYIITFILDKMGFTAESCGIDLFV